MADLEASRINHDNHLLLDQPCLRLPYELLRKNFRSVHYPFDKDSTAVKALLKDTANGSLNGKTSPQDVVKNLDQMLVKMRGLKRKLAAAADEEDRLYRQMDARVAHLRDLADLNTVDDVKYEAWSRQRLDRLLVDYMLRRGHDASAIALADERGIRDLVDIDTFVLMSRIRKSLEAGSVTDALAWCNENKKELRKMQSNLEFMLRCQQYIEMMRTGSQPKMLEAIAHAKKHITPFNDTFPVEVSNMAGLLAYRPDTPLEPYASLYSADRWQKLADAFVEAHLKLLNLPMTPLLHIALSSGLSALKTPACHSGQGQSKTQAQTQTESQQPPPQPGQTTHNGIAPTSAVPSPPPLPPPSTTQHHPHHHHHPHQHHHHGTASLTTRVCPICSTELNALARNVRYAHHGKSRLLEHDLVLLPNGRVYGRARLDEYASKSGLPAGRVKDLVTGEVYGVEVLRKVFVT
ncbi:CTLH/CRA C-terminal to lish motif domain-containing protein [Staphylotrichum tortipilum]|uniref:CTLH/CRA C-terminal to lish motif domain-containing protein n=1 Tax=Staphylotrichum tortipilum TaxID=2831512 RepID=A0AAN6MI08_9PEZI|nr:CTLH/CRA C-terminal to lish motif domain-containing protein [Staphylotrichum longicolle]